MADFEEPLSDEEKVWGLFNSLLSDIFLICKRAHVLYIYVKFGKRMAVFVLM